MNDYPHRELQGNGRGIAAARANLRFLKAACLGSLFALLAACGGGGGSAGGPAPDEGLPAPAVDDCGETAQKQFVLATAREWYRWADELAPVAAENYATAKEFLAALTAPLARDSRDRGFSYLTTVAEDEARSATGAYAGFGFRFARAGDGRYRVSDVYENGPAFTGGFLRGAELLAVDRGEGFTTLVDYAARGVGLGDIFGPPRAGVERGFRLRIKGEIREIRIAKTALDVPPIAGAPRLLERPGLAPVGYFHMRQFTRAAEPELYTLFGEFRKAGVTDFVIDLRYNNGGNLGVTNRLLDLLNGAMATGRPAYLMRHNPRKAERNYRYGFGRLEQSVSPNRIAFITSRATASASELVINSLAPYVEIVLVGGDTLGKAVGQYAFDQQGCRNRLRLITFDLVNGEGLGEYFRGLVNTGRFTLCAVEDRYRGAFGDPGEALLAGALDWLNTGSCRATASAGSGKRAPPRGPALDVPPELPERRSPWVQ